MFNTNTQSESIKVSNVNSWVNSATNPLATETSTTAFVVQNTGSKAITINSITLRGVQVPTASWYYVITGNQSELQSQLQVDFVEAGGFTGITGVPTTPGPISLSQGEAAVVYLSEAGNMSLLDSGNTYALQIQAGQATAVQQVQVITAAAA